MFAIIQTGGKQYKVNEGDVIFVEKLNVEEGAEVTFDQVLAVSNDSGFVAGAPYILTVFLRRRRKGDRFSFHKLHRAF